MGDSGFQPFYLFPVFVALWGIAFAVYASRTSQESIDSASAQPEVAERLRPKFRTGNCTLVLTAIMPGAQIQDVADELSVLMGWSRGQSVGFVSTAVNGSGGVIARRVARDDAEHAKWNLEARGASISLVLT